MSYTRVAVVQLDVQPAVVSHRRSALENPLFGFQDHDGLEPPDGAVPNDLVERLAALRGRVRAAYVEQLWARVQVILASCRAWGVKVVVFPEYAIPWDILPRVAMASGDMVVVAGTHSVERAGRKSGVYEALGWKKPPSGAAVAPVLYKERLVGLQRKMTTAKPERGSLIEGDAWDPIEFDAVAGPGLPSPMGVLICLDFLFRERERHRTQVAEALERARFLAVPSYTPTFTMGEFGAKGWEDAKRYGRPVLYSNVAKEGGSSMFVDEGRRDDLGRFPERVGVLRKGEEGVLIADVNLGYERVGKSTRYADQAIVVPFAAASLVYRFHPAEEEFASWAVENAEALAGDCDVDDEVDRLEAAKDKVDLGASLSGSDTRRFRLRRMQRELAGINTAEELRRFTREIVMPPAVLPMSRVRQALAAGAVDEVFDWRKEHRGGYDAVEDALRKVAQGFTKLDRAERTEAAAKAWAGVKTAVAGPREEEALALVRKEVVAPAKVLPSTARISPHEEEVGKFKLVFRDKPSQLLHPDGAPPPSRKRTMTANWAPSQVEVATDVWLAMQARGHDATVVGMVGDGLASFVVVLHCEGDERIASVAAWGFGGDAARRAARLIGATLAESDVGRVSVRVIKEADLDAELQAHRERIREGARKSIEEALALRTGKRGFVQPFVKTGDDVLEGFAALDTWLDSSDRAGLLLGPFGTGKSTLLAQWTHTRLDADGPLPVLVDLAKTTAADAVGMVCEALGLSEDRDRAAVSWLLRRGEIVVGFDGFDEMATRRTVAEVTTALRDLMAVAGTRGRVLVSSRDHYFTSEAQASQAANEAAAAVGLGRVQRFDLQPFGWDEVEKLVRQVVHEEARQKEVLEKIETTYDLLDLVKTPLLLHMVLATIDDIDPSARVGSATIYEEYLERWLDNAEQGDTELFSKDNKRGFAEVLAAELWRTGEASIAYPSLHSSIMTRLLSHPLIPFPQEDLEAAYMEIQGGSFFVREGDDRFRFAHKSFLEFFVARGLLAALERDPALALDTKPMTVEVAAFVAELVRGRGEIEHPGIASMRSWLTSRGVSDAKETKRAAANALRLLRDVPRALGVKEGWVPAGAGLREIDLFREELRGLVLRKVVFDEARLAAVDFTDASLEGASLREATLNGSKLRRTDLGGTDFSGASLRGVQGHACRLEGTRFDRASLQRSTWTGCDWSAAVGERVEVGPTVLDGAVRANGDLRVHPPRGKAELRLGHTNHVACAAWSRDGSRVASTSYDGSSKLWDASDASLIATLNGHSDHVFSVTWSHDDARLASASRDGSIRVWDAHDGSLIATLQGHKEAVFSLAWSHDGKYIASASKDTSIRLWDSNDGSLIATLQDHDDAVYSVAWSHDSARLASASADLTVKIWSPNSGSALKTLEGHSRHIFSVAWSPDGTRVASASADNEVRIWTTEDGTTTHIFKGHEALVNSVAWSHDGTRLASASKDRTVRLWDTQSGSPAAVLRGHELDVNSVAWSPDDTRIASASSDYSIKIWNVHDVAAVTTLEGHNSPVYSVYWSRERICFAVAGRDNLINIWSADQSSPLATLAGHFGSPISITWSHDRTRIASVSYDNTVAIWDARSGSLLTSLSGVTSVAAVVWSHNDTRIAVASRRGTITIWDAESGDRTSTLNGSSVLASAVWSHDDSRLAAASYHGSVEIWDIERGSVISSFAGPSSVDYLGSYTIPVAWSHDDTRIASLSHSQSIALWNVSDGSVVVSFDGKDGPVAAVAWSHDEARIATASRSGSITLFNIRNGSVAATIGGCNVAAESVGWSDDDAVISAVFSDGSTRLWKESGGPLLCTFSVTREGRPVAYAPNGQHNVDTDVDVLQSLALATAREDQGANFYLPFPADLEAPSHELLRQVLIGDQDETGTVDERLAWKDAKPWDGTTTYIDLGPDADSAETRENEASAPVPNPFVAGPPLDGTQVPYGRKPIFGELLDHVQTNASARVMALRRAGKTSLRNYITTALRDERLVVDLSLQNYKEGSLVAPDDLAAAFLDYLSITDTSPSPAERFEQLLDTRQDERPLLLLDEIAYLSSASKDLLSWLRSLGQERAAILYFGTPRDWTRVLGRAARVGSSFGNDVKLVELPDFSDEMARTFLVERAPPDVPIPHDTLAKWVVELCGGRPFYLQAMGSAIVLAHRSGSPPRTRSEVHELYRDKLLRGWTTAFLSLWDDIPPKAQRIVADEVRRVRKTTSSLRPGQKLSIEKQECLQHHGLMNVSGHWLLDRPFQDWLRELSTLTISPEATDDGEPV